MDVNESIKMCIQEVLLLSLLKSFCEKNESTDAKQRLRNIYSRSSNPYETTKNIIANELQEDVSLAEARKLYPMIIAFLNKSNYRKQIPDSIKINLLNEQNYKCAICGEKVDMHGHVDHVVPFKYVGDELENNYQLLCANCNFKKNASIDFQIRFLLKSI